MLFLFLPFIVIKSELFSYGFYFGNQMVDHKTIDVYNAKVNEYSQMGGFTTNKHLKDFVKLQKRNNLILDLGCGHGAAASYMIKEGLKCYAVDASSKMVKLAR